jgi:hypothetical protein
MKSLLNLGIVNMVVIHVYKWMESLIKWKKFEKLLKYFEETPFCSFGGSWFVKRKRV